MYTGLPLDLSNAAWCILYLALAAWLAKNRQNLRIKLGGREGNFVNDCVCYFCCGCCTIIQDARQADLASQTRIDCCFQLLQASPSQTGPVVGQAVVAAPQAVVVARPVEGVIVGQQPVEEG